MIVTLQEVIILRISDFRRFYNPSEFWHKKNEFLALFKKEIVRRTETPTKPQEEYFFVDSKEEFYLLQKFYDWQMNLSKELTAVEMTSSEVKIKTSEGDLIYPLGRLSPYIEKAKRKLTKKTILGYTLLYLLLNVNERNSDIRIEYGDEANGYSSSNDDIAEYNKCWDDITIRIATTVEYPLRRCVFANANITKTISIAYGDNTVRLSPSECVVGLFCGSKCYRLLPNTVTENGITLKLKINDAFRATILEVHETNETNETRLIPDVVSMGLETEGYLVSCTSKGEIQYDQRCFALNERVVGFREKCREQLLAFSKDGGHYTFYTVNQINN